MVISLNVGTREYIGKVLDDLVRANPEQHEFHQAAREVLTSLKPVLDEHPEYVEGRVLERLVEPENIRRFDVTWVGDTGETRVNKGYRVQFNSSIGPYKGGLRFHPSVNLSIIKFLGFEQIFKNALTGLPLGGGKGGSDFDPKGKSEAEVMRFCQSFMRQLRPFIGQYIDVPAGDIGVTSRMLDWMDEEYMTLVGNGSLSSLTGKSFDHGGSNIRPEATGYGLVYFLEQMLSSRGESIGGKICTVSGAGNVAIYTIEKLYQLGAIPVTTTDSGGMIYHQEGINLETLKQIKEALPRGSLQEYAKKHSDAAYTPRDEYLEGNHPVWSVPCDVALPCATENELNIEDAITLVRNGCVAVAEGANMPCTPEAIEVFLQNRVLYGSAKATNAGGVAVSGLEMEQNRNGVVWPREEVDEKLRGIMEHIYTTASQAAARYGAPGNFVVGANAAGFIRVANAMLNGR